MPTSTLLRDDGNLRHGHPTDSGNRMQWHNANAKHRTDPDAHHRENSWTEPNWTRGQAWSLTEEKRTSLLKEAMRTADGDDVVRHYTPPTTPRATVIDEVVEAIKSLDPAVGTPDFTQQFQNALDPIVERLEDAEQLVTHMAKELRNHDAELMNLSDWTEVRDRVTKIEHLIKRVQTFEVTNNGVTHKTTGLQHFKFAQLLKLATSLPSDRRNIWITGPAGSGKTFAAEQLANTLGLPYEFLGAIDTPYKLSGYLNPTGQYVSTAFRRIYEGGGVILLDEIDAGSAGALLEINAATAGNWASFPDKMVRRHADCYILAAANTWGFGGDSNYVGRNKLDAAFLTRFLTLSWPYDEVLEREVAQHDDWVDIVHRVRHAAQTQGAQVVISPRASYFGADLLRAGLEPAEVVEAVFGSIRAQSTWPNIGQVAEAFARSAATVRAPEKPVVTPATPPPPSANPALVIPGAKFSSSGTRR